MIKNGILIPLVVTPVVAFLGFGAWLIAFSKDDAGFRVMNDTDRVVRVVACSQDRPDFPGSFSIKPRKSVVMEGDWLPSDDPGAACFVSSESGTAKAAWHGCLKMPTENDSRDTFDVSESDQSLSRGQCLALSDPGLP